MMTLTKWAQSALKGLEDVIASLPDSAERMNVEDLLDELKRVLQGLVELEEEEES